MRTDGGSIPGIASPVSVLKLCGLLTTVRLCDFAPHNHTAVLRMRTDVGSIPCFDSLLLIKLCGLRATFRFSDFAPDDHTD